MRNKLIMQFKLIEEILKLSEAADWEGSKTEWELSHIEYSRGDPKTCLCGHFPIIELCYIKNKINNNQTIVGNCCIKKFFENINSDPIFLSIKKIKKDITRSVSSTSLDYFYKNKYLNKGDFEFYSDISSKRNLSVKQQTQKERINKQILKGFELGY